MRTTQIVKFVVPIALLAVLVAGCGSSGSTSKPTSKLHVTVLPVGTGNGDNMGLEAKGGGQVANVNWAITGDIVKFDPAYAYDYNTTPVVAQSCEGLLQYNEATGALLPALATSWSEPNPTTYVYNIRQGVHFWNGTELTPADVVFSYRRMAAKSTAAYASFYYLNVKSIDQTGPWQVTVKLIHPDTQWKYVPAQVASGAVMSKAYALAHAKSLGEPGTAVMCTGPFKFVQWVRGQDIVLRRFNGYWNKAEIPKVAQITFKVITDPTTLIEALNSGAVDGTLYGLDGREAQELSGPINLITSPSDTYFALYFNTARKPWNNPAVREAFALALDRPGIDDSVYNGFGVDTKSPVPPVLWTYEKSEFSAAYNALPSYSANLAEAKKLIASAGAKGTSATLMLSTATDQRVALFVQQAATELGINLSLRQLDYAQKTAIEYNDGPKNFDLDLLAATSDNPDPLNQLFLAYNSANVETDVSAYKNPLVDKYLDEAQSSSTQATEAGLTIKAQALIMKDLPMIPYIAADSLVPLNKRLTGFVPTFFSYWTPWAAQLSGTTGSG